MLDPGVDESDECIVAYPAGEIPGVEVTVGDKNEDSFVKYPIIKIPGVDAESSNAKLPGMDTDFDAESTGVEMDTGAYGEAYEAVPQEQGNTVEVDGLDKVYGLRQQSPTDGMVFVENNIEKHRIQVSTSIAQQRLDKLTQVKHKNVALTQVMALLLKLVMLVTMTGTTVAHKFMKAPPTKRRGADADCALNNETLHWHEVTGKQKKQALGVPVG